MKSRISRTLAVLLAMSLAGFTEVAQAWQTPTPFQQTTTTPANSTTPQTTATPAQDTTTTTPAQETTPKAEDNASDPNHVPAPGEVLPNAPSADTQNANSSSSQTKDQQPLGTAAAEKGVTRGGAASRPAGTALAGVKQKQSRGLLIKVGAVLAAGAALGTVYALSRSTSPVPPGATAPAAVRLR